MTLIATIDFWGEVAVVIVLLYVAYKVIAQRLNFEQPTLEDLKKWF